MKHNQILFSDFWEYETRLGTTEFEAQWTPEGLDENCDW